MRGPWAAWRSRRALRMASMLDRVVDSQLPLMHTLSDRSRGHSAEYLAEVVTLSQAYRHYAAGWIDRGELDRRAGAALRAMDELRQLAARLTERE